jgi:hypothetical protein
MTAPVPNESPAPPDEGLTDLLRAKSACWCPAH